VGSKKEQKWGEKEQKWGEKEHIKRTISKNIFFLWYNYIKKAVKWLR